MTDFLVGFRIPMQSKIRNLRLLDDLDSASWQQVSGPGAASFSDSAALQTNVAFPQTGTYVLQLTLSVEAHTP